MTIHPIRLFGDPVLRTKAAPVVDFDAELRRRINTDDTARRLTTIPFDSPLPLRFGLQLCVGVGAAEMDGTIRFYGAGAGFAAG